MWLQAAQAVATFALWVAALFLGAGRLGWTRGWISAGLYVIGMAGLTWFVWWTNPALLAARAKWRRKDIEPFDKLFLALMLPLWTVQPLVAGWDSGCAGCTALPFVLVYPGALLFLLGAVLLAWAMAVNPHAETTVRIQTDRGHVVVRRGPYRWVRHPMYVGAVFLQIGLALVWGSRWAMAVAAAIIGLFVWRTALEDRTLRRELAGYEEYAAHTRYRLLPGIW